MNGIFKNQYVRNSLFLMFGLLVGWAVFHSSGDTATTSSQLTVTDEPQAEVWTCSMHPQIRMDKPGKCPICAMDLILLNQGGSGDDAMAVHLTKEAVQLANVQTSVVSRQNPVKELRLYGKVMADERLRQNQVSHVSGRIEKLFVNFTGELVAKGQKLAMVYSPELVTAQQELLEAVKTKLSQPEIYEASKERLRQWKLTDGQISDIERSGNVEANVDIISTTNGIVTSKLVNSGDYVNQGFILYEVSDLSQVWVLFDAYESDLPFLKRGDGIDFTLQALPGNQFSGTIRFIDPVIDPTSRVAKVRVEISNPGAKLKPEMFAIGVVQSRLGEFANQLVIPRSAVLWTGKRSVVYLKQPGDEPAFRLREIELGAQLGDSYVVTSGLADGEEIVTEGAFSVDASAQLAGKPSMMNPEGGVSMTGHNHGGSSMDSTPESVAEVQPVEVISIAPQAKEVLRPLYSAYLKWKDALVGDDFEVARKGAENMKSALERIDMGLFKGEAHGAWMDFQGDLANGLKHIQHFTEIEALRQSFQTVSSTMILLMSTFQPIDKVVYVQYCPMANDNQGAYWLSSEKEVRNPYFGSSMLTCGEVAREIK